MEVQLAGPIAEAALSCLVAAQVALRVGEGGWLLQVVPVRPPVVGHLRGPHAWTGQHTMQRAKVGLPLRWVECLPCHRDR